MRILHINQQNAHGGAAKIANYLVEGLNDEGIEAELWYFYNKGNNTDYSKCIYPFLERYRKDSLTDKLIKKMFDYYRLYFGDVSNPFFKSVIRKIYKWKPDIIHLHNLHGGWADLNSIAELSRNIKVILTLHDEWIITGHCGVTMDCLGWMTSCGECPDLSTYVPLKRSITKELKKKKEEFVSILAKNDAILVTPSKWLKKRIINSGIWQGKEIIVIPNGIDTSRFPEIIKDRSYIRKELELPLNKKIGLFVADGGSHSIYKDFLTVKKTIEMMMPNISEDFALVIAGDNLENKEIIKINNTDVIKLGYLQEKNLAKYYSAVDILLYPSKADNLPLVVLEAMAAGLPIISTPVGGIPELIVSEKTGILIPKQSPNHLLKALIDFINNEYDYKQMGLNARESMYSHYDLKHMASNYLNLYCQYIKS
jgi:glycosyltransferase involved in cell wall biosynthesis